MILCGSRPRLSSAQRKNALAERVQTLPEISSSSHRGHVWTAPLGQGSLFGSANISGAVMSTACSCGIDCPLALMVDPPGSCPNHRSAFALTPTPNGLSSHSVRSHHPVVALDCVSPCGDNPFSASGLDGPVVVITAPRQKREDDPRELVGERHSG